MTLNMCSAQSVVNINWVEEWLNEEAPQIGIICMCSPRFSIWPLGSGWVQNLHLILCPENRLTWRWKILITNVIRCWHIKSGSLFRRKDFWTLWGKARVGCFERTASKHVYYLGWNRSSAQAGCMRQVLGPGALGRPRGIGWRGRWEGWSG